MIFLDVFLRRKGCCREVVVSSDEEGAHRRTASCRGAQLRGATAGRRRMRCGWPNSGEAAVVGGDDLFGCFPPAERLLPEVVVSSDEEGAHRRTASCPVSQLRGANAGRRRMRGGRLNSGEAAWSEVIDLFGCSSSGRSELHQKRVDNTDEKI